MNAKKHSTAPERAGEIVDEILDKAGLDDDVSVDADTGEGPGGKQLKEANDRIIRLMADFDNYRKRVQREKEDWVNYAAMNLMEKLLPVLDNLDRALDNVQSQDEEVRGIFSGIAMTHRQLLEVLQSEGLRNVDDLGHDFDPTLHEAVMTEPAGDDEEDNEIVGVLRKGYCFKDKLLRAAMVKVAKK